MSVGEVEDEQMRGRRKLRCRMKRLLLGVTRRRDGKIIVAWAGNQKQLKVLGFYGQVAEE